MLLIDCHVCLFSPFFLLRRFTLLRKTLASEHVSCLIQHMRSLSFHYRTTAPREPVWMLSPQSWPLITLVHSSAVFGNLRVYAAPRAIKSLWFELGVYTRSDNFLLHNTVIVVLFHPVSSFAFSLCFFAESSGFRPLFFFSLWFSSFSSLFFLYRLFRLLPILFHILLRAFKFLLFPLFLVLSSTSSFLVVFFHGHYQDFLQEKKCVQI